LLRISGQFFPQKRLSTRAIVGSTRVARRAGNQQAATPAPSTTTATVAKVSGSRAPTPNSSLASTLLAAKLAPKPTARPIPTGRAWWEWEVW
jgi:hypothetical protein